MLTSEELKEAERQSQKSKVVKKLLDYWQSAQTDGELAIRIALNNKWLEFSKVIEGVDIPISNHEKIKKVVNIFAIG